MCKYAKESSSKKFIVGTENGIIHRLKKENPEKEFIIAYDGAICPNMKLTTLERIYTSLKEEKHLVKIPEVIATKARATLERMFEVKS
jgi:quinolinate synthase